MKVYLVETDWWEGTAAFWTLKAAEEKVTQGSEATRHIQWIRREDTRGTLVIKVTLVGYHPDDGPQHSFSATIRALEVQGPIPNN